AYKYRPARRAWVSPLQALQRQEQRPQAVAPAPGRTRSRGPRAGLAREAETPRGDSRAAAGQAAAQATRRASYDPPGCGERSNAETQSPSRLSSASVSVGRWIRPTLKVPVHSDVLTMGLLASVVVSLHRT